MRKKSFILLILPSFVISLSQCGGNSSEKPTETKKKIVTNPNGMSEMAILMEEMSNTMFSIRDSIIKSGNLPQGSSFPRFAAITIAKTTKKNVLTTQYIAYAESFLKSYEILLSSEKENLIKEFNRTVTSCKNCHQDICPGPLARINKLFIAQN